MTTTPTPGDHAAAKRVADRCHLHAEPWQLEHLAVAIAEARAPLPTPGTLAQKVAQALAAARVGAPTEHDRSRAAQMIAYADGELELRDAIAQAITDARAEGRRAGELAGMTLARNVDRIAQGEQ